MIKSIITNIIVPFIAIGGVAMAIYNSMLLDQEVQEKMRIADSLRAEVQKYHAEYDKLCEVAKKQDAIIAEQKADLEEAKKRKPKPPQPKPPVTEVQEAIDILKNL